MSLMNSRSSFVARRLFSSALFAGKKNRARDLHSAGYSASVSESGSQSKHPKPSGSESNDQPRGPAATRDEDASLAEKTIRKVDKAGWDAAASASDTARGFAAGVGEAIDTAKYIVKEGTADVVTGAKAVAGQTVEAVSDSAAAVKEAAKEASAAGRAAWHRTAGVPDHEQPLAQEVKEKLNRVKNKEEGLKKDDGQPLGHGEPDARGSFPEDEGQRTVKP